MFTDDKDGAIDFKECPSRPRRCKCGKCEMCGHPKHVAIHGPFDGTSYGHKFKAAE